MTELAVSGLRSVAEAIQVIDATPVHPRAIRLPLIAASGLRLARPLHADRDYPPFYKSLMDGYAVRCPDVRATPADLRLVGEIPAGRRSDRTLGAGETMAIMTGAPLPEGADGVVPVEDVQTPGEEEPKSESRAVRILRADNPARFVARQGSDRAAGSAVLEAGTMLGPAQIAVAATVGAWEVEVFAAPRVAVLCTGDEIVAPDAVPHPWQLRNSNAPMLVALLRRSGCEVIDLGVVRDDPELLRDALGRGLEHDALLVSGGMSMGEYDYVPRLLRELGVTLKITKLKIKPGKPFVFGVRPARCSPSDGYATGSPASESGTGSFVFGLPGNPVSAYVCTVRLAWRLLSRMAGGRIEERWLTGRLDQGQPANGPREFYQPAIRIVSPGRDSSHGEFASITALPWKSSADLFTLARANVLLVRPENDPPLPRGTIVRVLET